MLTRNVRVEGFTAEDWEALQRVLGGGAPGANVGSTDGMPPADRAGDAPDVGCQEPDAGPVDDGSGVIAFVSGDRLSKLVSTRTGRLDPSLEPWPAPLDALARRYDASWALELQAGALEELSDRFATRLTPAMEYLGQLLLALEVMRELEAERALRCWPWRLGSWQVPSEALGRRLFDSICPAGHALLLGAFERGGLATAVAARRGAGGFDWIVGPDELRREMGLLSGDFTRDYYHLARAAERRVAPLAVGCFAESETLMRLTSRAAEPGAFALAVAARDVIVSPAAPGLAVPLGIDVGRATLVKLGQLAERLGVDALWRPGSALRPVLTRLRGRASMAPSLITRLGFEPLALVRLLLLPGRSRASSGRHRR